MAERSDIDFTYSLTDRIVRLSLGELADFSGAKYDGDFSLSLEQAQRRLNYVRDRGATGVGVTLSSAQLEAWTSGWLSPPA